MGWALRALNCGCAAAWVEQGPHPQPHSARKKAPQRGLSHFGGEGGIQLARFAGSLPTCRCAAALVEQGSNAHTHSAKMQKAPKRGLSHFGGEGGIQLARFAGSLPTCRCAAALVEQGSNAHTHSAKMQKAPKGAFHILAERVGFEPTVRENRTPDFESGPFDHSGTSP